MKIKPEHFHRLCELCAPIIPKLDAHRTALASDPRVKDVDKRLRWDMLWAIPAADRMPLMDAIYLYANDTHVDTALRYIVANTAAK